MNDRNQDPAEQRDVREWLDALVADRPTRADFVEDIKALLDRLAKAEQERDEAKELLRWFTLGREVHPNAWKAHIDLVRTFLNQETKR